MSVRRRIHSLAIALVAALALSACSGLPVTGTVNPGFAADQIPDAPDFVFAPDGPQVGMTPEQIVQGFIDAGTSPEGNWAIANLFLAEGTEWRPQAQVFIDAPGNERLYNEVGDDEIAVTVTQTAGVDGTGAFTSFDSVAAVLPFTLAQQEDGEWRITQAPDGVVLERDLFVRVFAAYPVMFFDPEWQYLVPDVRWFPARTNAATRISQALIDGQPTPWLADSVFSAFTDDVALAQASVTVDGDRVATVPLNAQASALEQTTIDRMQAQLEASLAPVGVQTVRMTADGAEITATAAPTRSTRVSSSPLVLTEAGFGFLSADELTPIVGLSDALTSLEATPVSIEVSATRTAAAVRVAAGPVARVQADGGVLEVDTRAGLIDPSIDARGFVWTVPKSAPTAVTVSGVEGGPATPVANAWPEASEITSLRVSRDGTRVAALLAVGAQNWVVVAAVVRDDDGVPVSLSEPQQITRLDGTGIAAAWLDDANLGVVSSNAGTLTVTQILVGGEATRTEGPVGVTSVAGANQTSAMRLRDDTGALYVRRGSNWGQTASGIIVLASQQGQPQ